MSTNLDRGGDPAGETDRRAFLQTLGLGAAALGLAATSRSKAAPAAPPVQGFEEQKASADTARGWQPYSDRKLRVGLVGYGFSHFSAAFGFQDHPNVQVVAVSDLFPDRCAALSQRVKCGKTYPSLEEMVKDDSIEAIFLATDPPSHPSQCKLVLEHGKHVCHTVPAVFGSLEDAHLLYDAVKAARGLRYMMFETSAFRPDNFAMRQIYQAGGFGEVVYSEGEYIHYMPKPLPSYKGWRNGSPPLWYPTHAAAYPLAVTNGSFTEVSAKGFHHDENPWEHPDHNAYRNPFGTEIGLFRTSVGGVARVMMCKDSPGFGAEAGRVRGTKGAYNGSYQGTMKDLPNLHRPPLPPGVAPGGHGGSHGYLMSEFVHAVITDRKPLVDVRMALNLTVPGIVAHASAVKDGETLKIPQFDPV